MNKKIIVICLVLCLGINFSIVSANVTLRNDNKESEDQTVEYDFSEEYGIQWEMNFGSDRGYGARYEGPQPIGDCDNDGFNEMLVGGRDNKLRVFEWDQEKQTYLEMHTIFPPLYPYVDLDPGGFAIGDLTGDGENEIGATFGTSVHKWTGSKYKTIGYNPWIFVNGGGSGDCYIGDYDNDGKNELIVTGGRLQHGEDIPEIVIFKMTALGLVREAEWDNPASYYSYIYMPGLGDIDGDGENELVVGSSFKVFVLDWNKDTQQFDETVIKETGEDYYPFACVLKDSDMDGKNEINIGYWSPMISIFEWNGANYELKYEKEWLGEGTLIEGLDVGDVDDDGRAEVCAGTHVVHILQWNGSSYEEEAVLPTFGHLAVVSIGDCDNDGKNEIQAGSVMIDHPEDFMTWVYKYGIEPRERPANTANGRLKVYTKSTPFDRPIKNASVAAWNLETGTWYDIQPHYEDTSMYYRWDLPEGEYYLRAHMDEYKVGETTVTINAGEETTFTFTLNKATRSRNTPVQRPMNNLLLQILEKIMDYFPILAKFLHILI